ncbi:unnamed protein product [Coffea canephora]|uniref:GRF-type domain-containing protein n=1 Tax=Coffea canephora TaxID=49390 RepID=A0A068V889_COFCA|nr:unnamed protein product [Coffea canephora]
MVDEDHPTTSRRMTSSSGSVLCVCGAGVCLLLTSKSQANPGRSYYRCPASNRGCGFFRWLDQVRPDQLIFNIPQCGCGAGICRLDIKTTTGPNAGRKCFVCPIKKGQGACNFFMWLDAHSNAATAFQCSRSRRPTSSLLKRDKIILEESKGSDDDPLRKHCKRLRHGDSKSNGCPSGSSTTCQRTPLASSGSYLTEKDGQDSSPTIEMAVHQKKPDFGRPIFFENTLTASKSFLFSRHQSSVLPINLEGLQETSWIVTAIRQNLCLEIKGWWGRLAFPPSKGLKEQSAEPFFCCAFPSFDPIFVPPNVNLLSDDVSVAPVASPLGASRQSSLTLSEGAQLLGTEENSIMRKLVSEAFVKAAEQLQSDLLTLLRSLDIQDHEFMVREADATFDALDQLQIEHKKYSEQVKEYIRCASLLAKINQSVISDHSCRMLADRYSHEKLKLDEIDDAYARDVAALSVSEQRAEYFAIEISHLKDKLFQTEAGLSCCMAESTALKARILGISEDKEIIERSFEMTCKQLEDARKMRKQREAEEHAAKAAFQNAKTLIWGF